MSRTACLHTRSSILRRHSQLLAATFSVHFLRQLQFRNIGNALRIKYYHHSVQMLHSLIFRALRSIYFLQELPFRNIENILRIKYSHHSVQILHSPTFRALRSRSSASLRSATLDCSRQSAVQVMFVSATRLIYEWIQHRYHFSVLFYFLSTIIHEQTVQWKNLHNSYICDWWPFGLKCECLNSLLNFSMWIVTGSSQLLIGLHSVGNSRLLAVLSNLTFIMKVFWPCGEGMHSIPHYLQSPLVTGRWRSIDFICSFSLLLLLSPIVVDYFSFLLFSLSLWYIWECSTARIPQLSFVHIT